VTGNFCSTQDDRKEKEDKESHDDTHDHISDTIPSFLDFLWISSRENEKKNSKKEGIDRSYENDKYQDREYREYYRSHTIHEWKVIEDKMIMK
jgi:hypothetical protein